MKTPRAIDGEYGQVYVLREPTTAEFHGIEFPTFTVETRADCLCYSWPCPHGPQWDLYRCLTCGWETTECWYGVNINHSEKARDLEHRIEFHAQRCKP